MKDVTLDIVKDNLYFIKSPFNGRIIIINVENGKYVDKGQVMALVKTDSAYVDVESEYSGIVERICVNPGSDVEKWQNLAVVNVKNSKELYYFNNIATTDKSPDYEVIYTFQQEVLPGLIYSETENFIKGIAFDESGFIYFLFKEFYENNKRDFPFEKDDFIIVEQVIGDIIFIEIDWPKLNGPLLAWRTYILINSVNQKIQVFNTERYHEDDMIIVSVLPVDGQLKHYNYGIAPDEVKLEKQKVINIFIE